MTLKLSGFGNWRTLSTYARTPTFIGVRMILDMRTLTRTLIFSLLFLKVFKNFFEIYSLG